MRTSRYQPSVANALLFNNLSDNLCGHSQDDIEACFGRQKQFKVLKSDQSSTHLNFGSNAYLQKVIFEHRYVNS
ncbi:hypothetical protein CH49_3999 [Yersinia enterocolitica]|nr:hypothetical protein CH49_3999 [Yersinia enterocolitica]